MPVRPAHGSFVASALSAQPEEEQGLSNCAELEKRDPDRGAGPLLPPQAPRPSSAALTMMPAAQQIPWRSVYFALGLLLAGEPSRQPSPLPASRRGDPDTWHKRRCPLWPSGCRRRRCRLTAACCRPLPSCAGLTMFVSGLVLWQTEGNSALIGLWICGLLVFIPGFYFT